MTDKLAHSPGGPEESDSLVRILLLSAGAILFLSFGNTEMAGSDLWWHLAAGRELFQTGSLWMVDDWSFTAPGGDWLNHEWLSDIVFYTWAKIFGLTSLVYWKWLVVVFTFLLLQQVLRRQTGNELSALLGAGIAIALAAPFIDMRPHIYSLLNFSLLLMLALERQPRNWVLGILFLVWVNLHGGFFFGLMALGILIFPWRNFSIDNVKLALVTGLFCVAACVINPSGFKTFLYPLSFAFDSSSPYREVTEWHSPFREGGIRAPLFFTFMWFPLAGLLYAVPAVRSRVAVPWEGLFLTALTLAMALTSRRFIPLFGMSLAVMLTPLFSLLLGQVRARVLLLTLAVLALVVACFRVMPYSLKAAPSFHYLTAEYTYPEDMVDFIERNSITGNVYALYNWGGYLHWRTDGALKVFIDGRADTVYDGETYYHYGTVLSSREGWIDALEQTEADYILWPHARGHGQLKRRELEATGRWQVIYRDAVSWLAVRNSLPLAAPLQNPEDSPARKLTLAMEAAREGQDAVVLERVREVRRELPWQRTACQVEVRTLMKMGDRKGAAEVLSECLRYFPTRFLP